MNKKKKKKKVKTKKAKMRCDAMKKETNNMYFNFK